MPPTLQSVKSVRPGRAAQTPERASTLEWHGLNQQCRAPFRGSPASPASASSSLGLRESRFFVRSIRETLLELRLQ